jgi:hypothetical protein
MLRGAPATVKGGGLDLVAPVSRDLASHGTVMALEQRPIAAIAVLCRSDGELQRREP